MQWTGSERVLAEEADRVAHVLGAGRAVQADDVDLQRLERREHGVDVGAEQHLAAVGQQRDAASGSARVRPVSLNASRAPKIAALTSRMSWAVSMMIRSTPPSIRPWACSVKTSTSSRKVICAERRVVGGGEVAGRPDRAGDEAAPRRRPCGRSRRRWRLISSVWSARPHSSSLRRLAWKVSVSTTSAPASTIDSCTPSMTSGRLRTSTSWRGRAACSRPRARGRTARAWRPSPPSKTTTRSRTAARKSRSGMADASLSQP